MAGAWWLALLLLIPSCHKERQSVDRVDQPILAATPSGPTDDAVVHVWVGQRYCSGVLVAPNLMLTARYCLLELDSTEDQCNADGTNVVGTNVVTAQDVAAAQVEIRTGAIPSVEVRARGLEIISLESPTFCRNDIALVVLDRRIDHSPTMPIRLTRPTSIGEDMTLIGYASVKTNGEGVNQTDAGVNQTDAGVNQTDAGVDQTDAGVDQTDADVDQTDAGVRASQIGSRFRREGVPVLDVGANRFYEGAGSVPPGTLLLGPGFCDGALGSPAVAAPTGALVGVASVNGRPDRCSESAVNTYTLVAEYYDLVLKAFAVSGGEPWLEGEAAPMQSSVSADSGCTLATAPVNPAGLGWAAMLIWSGVALERRRCRRACTPTGQN